MSLNACVGVEVKKKERLLDVMMGEDTLRTFLLLFDFLLQCRALAFFQVFFPRLSSALSDLNAEKSCELPSC